MIDHVVTDIFIKLDDFMITAVNGKKGPESARSENEKWLFRLKDRNKDRKLSLSEVACLLMLFQLSASQSIKMFLFFNGRELAAMFPFPLRPRLRLSARPDRGFFVDFIHANLAKPEIATPSTPSRSTRTSLKTTPNACARTPQL